MKDQLIQDSNLYIYDDYIIETHSNFIYEININKYWKNGFSSLGSKFVKSDKLLNLKNKRKFIKYDDYFIEKEITLIGAPLKFIKEYNLQEYIPKKKKK